MTNYEFPHFNLILKRGRNTFRSETLRNLLQHNTKDTKMKINNST